MNKTRMWCELLFNTEMKFLARAVGEKKKKDIPIEKEEVILYVFT